MYRLTTPTHKFKFHFPISDIEKLLITYKQGGEIVLEKELGDCTVDGDTVYYTLTQEETKAFKAHGKANVQIRVLKTDGKALASEIYELSVKDVLNDEVLEDET